MKRNIAIFIVALAAVLWGFIGICSRALSDAGMNALQINGIRGFVCCVVLGIVLFFFNKSSLMIKMKDLWKFIIFALAKFAMDLCFIQGQLVSDLSLAGILLSTDTFFMIFISMIIFKEGLTPMKVIATALGFFGCTLVMNIMSGVENVNIEGVLWGLGSGLFGAIYASGLKISMNDGYKPYTVLFYMFLIGCFVYLPIMNLPNAITIMTGDISTVGYMLVLSLMFTLVPYYLYTVGLNYLEPITALILLFLEAVTSAIVGVVYFGEPMTVWMALGMAIVLASTILMEVRYEDGKFRI